jgi:hypothetical protein
LDAVCPPITATPAAKTAAVRNGIDAPASPINRMKTVAARKTPASRRNESCRPKRPASASDPISPPI